MSDTHPSIRLLFPLLAGILTFDFLNLSPAFLPLSLQLSGGIVFLGCVGLYAWENKSTQRAVVLAITLGALGFLATGVKHIEFQDDLSAVSEAETQFVFQIKTPGEKRKSTYRFEAELLKTLENENWKPVRIAVRLSLSDKIKKFPRAGDLILVKNQKLQRPPKALNPGEFDYRAYLERKGIAWTMYVNEQSLIILEGGETPWTTWPMRVSEHADAALKNHLNNPKAYGLVKAMLLGRREDLAQDQLNDYVSSGTVHVLAVSGLHVGILFALLSWLLAPLAKHPTGRYAYILFIGLTLGGYALITGLPASVIRASIMCFLFALTKVFQRRQFGLNTLSITAFFLLLLDPYALFTVGFQLSFAAVAGIMLAYPLLKNLFQIENKYLRLFWEVSAVGFAAQLFTFPISVFYFHQFPLYFWLVNPFVIFLTTFLIYGTIAILVSQLLSFQLLATMFAFGVDIVARLMNGFAQIPSNMPYGLLKNLHIDFVEVGLLFIILLLLYKLFSAREYTYLKAVAAVLFLYAFYTTVQLVDSFATSRLVFHAIPRHTVLTFTQGQSAFVAANPEFRKDSGAFDYHLANYFTALGIKTIEWLDLPPKELNESFLLRTPRTAIQMDALSETQKPQVVIVRNKRFPQKARLSTATNTVFVLSPELGYLTRKEWEKVLIESKNNFQDPLISGSKVF
ncbi:ComEC/Rec2 family competence protein [Arundinibacter roseus]|uniref:ComEC family competence protein n=1 Tax=Arundinibacter roseus TaxID=2070510 RepID=A0A4V2XAD7_9BACT|nr:ComEC/Rec2 family competence protein [Arundinibacter roseus]TDB66975.1 ComEC family competence protein [Arundinibacter roseus]